MTLLVSQLGNHVLFGDGLFGEGVQKALQVHPMCPASVRLGLGLCRYRLGQVKKARQAFERVLQARIDIFTSHSSPFVP